MNRNSKLIVFVAVLASLLEIIDSSIVNVALNSMMGNLGATLEDISMVVTGYAIANAVVLPVSAWMGERIGRRPYFLGCIVLFTLTSIACGLAPNLTTLIVFRILQGLAGGALLPTSQTLIYEQFPKEKAGMAGAIFGMSVMIGPALGPVMGGYLTDEFGWRMIFNINLPLGLLALFVGMAVIHNPPYQQRKQGEAKAPLDAIGLGLLVAGIGCLQYVLERGEADAWFESTAITINALVAAICLPMFVWWELKVEQPIINIRLFKENAVRNGVLLMGSIGFFLYAVVFILPIFMTRAYHYDATQVGMMFIPGSLVTMMMMPIVGRLLQGGVNPKILIFVGLTFVELFLFTMTRFSPLSDKLEILNALYIRGLAMAFLFVPINSSILSQFSGPTMGQVSGLLNLFRQIGGSVGIALVGTLITSLGHQNYIDLVPKVSMLNPNTQTYVLQSQHGLEMKMSEGLGMATGMQATLRSLYGRVQNQVFMMSFLQLVYIIMSLIVLAYIPLYLLKFKKKPVAVMDSH